MIQQRWHELKLSKADLETLEASYRARVSDAACKIWRPLALEIVDALNDDQEVARVIYRGFRKFFREIEKIAEATLEEGRERARAH